MSRLFVARFSIDESSSISGAGHIPAFVLLTGG